MNPITIRIARRLAAYMLERAEQANRISNFGSDQYNRDMAFFQGLGMGLAVCFEEMNGKSAQNVKPKDLLQWAMNLPDEKYPTVRPE